MHSENADSVDSDQIATVDTCLSGLEQFAYTSLPQYLEFLWNSKYLKYLNTGTVLACMVLTVYLAIFRHAA